MAKAVITELAPKPRRRKKREDETRGLFQNLALIIFAAVDKATKSREPDPWHMPPHDLDESQRWQLRQQESYNALWHHHQADHYQQQACHYDRSSYSSPQP